MTTTPNSSRRSFLRLASGTLVPFAGMARFGSMNAMAQAPDYKALVCIFLAGGNDGHNMVIPQTQSQFTIYKANRGSVALPDGNTKLLPITAKDGTPFAISDGLSFIHPLWAQQKLAILANTGNLVQPTSRAQYVNSQVNVPTNLFSHPDQTVQMQTATAGTSSGSGWAGRVVDSLNGLNGASRFPASISMAGQQLFCAGNIVQSASLIPGYDMQPYGMNVWPATAATARQNALQQVLTMDSGLAVIQAANNIRQDALDLSAMLKGLNAGSPLATPFPGTSLGQQLKQVAQIIQLRGSTGIRRQIFYCSLGGFDTHGGQSWMQWDLFKQLSDGMNAFYQATQEMGLANDVTTFTESEFGRTLQPSGSGSDHGWGSHFLVVGGAVKGGDIYGQFPDLSLGGPNDSTARGALLPTTSLDQYAATLSKWFGVPDSSLDAIFPNLPNFAARDLGFLT